jgi:hypothetical protein
MTKIKETIYDTNEVDNLYKIVDKLVELRNKPFKNNWIREYNYILSELQTYNRYIDYNDIRNKFKEQGLELK